MRTLLALVLFTVPLAAAPVPKALKKAPASLDGTWEVVEYHSNGNKMNNTVAIKWVIDGQNLSIERNNPRLVGGGLRAPANVSSRSILREWATRREWVESTLSASSVPLMFNIPAGGRATRFRRAR